MGESKGDGNIANLKQRHLHPVNDGVSWHCNKVVTNAAQSWDAKPEQRDGNKTDQRANSQSAMGRPHRRAGPGRQPCV